MSTTWHQLVQFTRSMTLYDLCSNVTSMIESGAERPYGLRLYIDGTPYSQDTIASSLSITTEAEIIELIPYLYNVVATVYLSI